MKWAVFICILAAVYPLGRLLRDRTNLQAALISVVGFMPFFGLRHVAMNMISFETYRGDARGTEVTIVDIIVAVLFFALPPSRHPSPYRVTRILYGIAIAASILYAPMPHYAFFGLWKILRMFLLVAVLARAFDHPIMPPAFLRGLGAGVLYVLGVALYQRYGLHLYQIEGTFSHQNSLGMAVNLVAPVVLGIMLAGQGGWLAWATLAASAVLIVLTLSRGSIIFFGLGCVTVYLGSLIRRPTARKIYVAAGSTALALAVIAKAYKTIVDRFVGAPASSEGVRVMFAEAARRMLHDHPFGIGINQYSYVLGHGGYAAMVGLPEDSVDGIVHNIYWLTAAELGYTGLIAFLLVLAVPLVLALRGAIVVRDIRGDVMLGCACGLMSMYGQSTLEWVPRQTEHGYLFWGLAAMVIALHRQTVAERAGHRNAALVGPVWEEEFRS